MRVGFGFDIHAYQSGEFVTLAGVRVPHSRGVRAHSDGDVLIHALCDALLGAMGLGDIGQHFPDNDPRWRNADSRGFLRHCARLVRENSWRTVNVDLTLLADAPRISPYRSQMRQNVASDLELTPDRVNIKATTCEGLGAIGRGEGLAAQAVVMLAHAKTRL